MARMIEELEDETGAVIKYKRHANGRGLVSPTARVAESAYIEPTAYVEADARVGMDAYVGAGSWIDKGATVGDRTFVGANVHVGAGCLVGSGVKIGSGSKLGENAMVGNGARLERDTHVPAGAVIELKGAPQPEPHWRPRCAPRAPNSARPAAPPDPAGSIPSIDYTQTARDTPASRAVFVYSAMGGGREAASDATDCAWCHARGGWIWRFPTRAGSGVPGSLCRPGTDVFAVAGGRS